MTRSGEGVGPDVTTAVERVRVPIPEQSFASEQDWINRATRALTSHPDYLNTEHGDDKGWRGPHFTALCFDQAGNRMRNGGDFMRATKEGTYPVWWIWPDQIVAILSELDRLSAALGEIVRLADTYEPVIEAICPTGSWPTPRQEQHATILAQPFIVARTALQQQEARDGRE